jgi:Cft2 family RNA processing exonuclease
MLYTESDIEKSMDKIETVNFHQEMEVNGIRFWCYHAGHVLGAAMFMIEIAGVKVIYWKLIFTFKKSFIRLKNIFHVNESYCSIGHSSVLFPTLDLLLCAISRCYTLGISPDKKTDI